MSIYEKIRKLNIRLEGGEKLNGPNPTWVKKILQKKR